MTEKPKQYGLIKPKKAQLSIPRPKNVFGDDSESDEGDGADWVKKALKAEGEKNRAKKQVQLNMQKALKENPTIYQYDEIYTDIHAPLIEKAEKKKEEMKPKYIGNLLKAAEKRKKEHEHRIERMVQKEREAEGAMYADKDSFVTSAYRAKLEEFKKMEEEEREADRLETIGDVTKQSDISGFYRHLYEQTVVKEDIDHEEVAQDKPVTKSTAVGDPGTSETNQDKDDSSICDSNSEDDSSRGKREEKTNLKELTKIISKSRKGKQYRQRVVEASESEDEEQTKSTEDSKLNEAGSEMESETHRKENLEAAEKIRQVESGSLTPEKKLTKGKESPTDKDTGRHDDTADLSSTSKRDCEEIKGVEEKNKPMVPENKTSIWEKRTVGEALEAALQRYYARKATRISGS